MEWADTEFASNSGQIGLLLSCPELKTVLTLEEYQCVGTAVLVSIPRVRCHAHDGAVSSGDFDAHWDQIARLAKLSPSEARRCAGPCPHTDTTPATSDPSTDGTPRHVVSCLLRRVRVCWS